MIVKSYSFIHMSGSFIPFPVDFSQAISVVIINSNVQDLWQLMDTGNYSFLEKIDITFNHIKEIKQCSKTLHLDSLKYLNLSSNMISQLSNFAFEGIYILKHLDLSHNQIDLLTAKKLSGLTQLHSLIITNNLLSSISINTFQYIEIKIIITSNSKICCVFNQPHSVCTRAVLYSSGCKKLLPFLHLKGFGVFFGFSILFLNSYFIIILVKNKLHNPQMHDSKKIYYLLTGLLHISDLFIALYLLIITSFDTIKGNFFIEESAHWKQSILCSFFVALSLCSLLFSFFLVLMIALSRYLVITILAKNPLNYEKIKRIVYFILLIILPLSIIISVVDRNYYNLSSPLCCFPGNVKPKFLFRTISVIIGLVSTITVIIINIIYFLGFITSQKVQKELSMSEKRQSRNTSFLFTIVVTIIPINFYYISLSIVYLTLSFQKYPPDIVLYYIVCILLPINPVLNSFLYHISEFKKLLVIFSYRSSKI